MSDWKISKETLLFFIESGLKKEHAKIMQIRDINSSELKKMFPQWKFSNAKISGHEIPYFGLDGELSGYSRYRLHHDEDPKYLQLKGQKSHFYFPPFMNWESIALDPQVPIYITEGERKAAKACVMDLPCLGLAGVWNWCVKQDDNYQKKIIQPIKDFQLLEWNGRKTYIVFDSDSIYNSNIEYAIQALRRTLIKFGADPYRIDLPQKGGNKVGLDDFLAKPYSLKAFKKLPVQSMLQNKSLNGQELIALKAQSTKWLIQGLIPFGLTILVGPAKAGKSWFILQCVLAVSSGTKAFGCYESEQAKCLYLALEDNEQRLRSRILSLSSKGYKINHLSYFSTSWEKVEDNGLEILEKRLDDEPDIKVVIIDTLAKFRRAPKAQESLYYQDYDAVGLLKKLADRKGVAIILVHHTKKGKSDDYIERVSGSMGIAGAADTVLILDRQRNSEKSIINITGRDVEERSLAFEFNSGVWIYIGEATELLATETHEEILELLRAEGRPLKQIEIAKLSGRRNGGLKKTLDRMVANGLIWRDDHLRYHPVEITNGNAKKFAKKEDDEE